MTGNLPTSRLVQIPGESLLHQERCRLAQPTRSSRILEDAFLEQDFRIRPALQCPHDDVACELEVPVGLEPKETETNNAKESE